MPIIIHYLQMCGNRFSNYGSLMAHLDTHTETRRFCCNYCSKKFRQKEKLKYHTRIHTGMHFPSWKSLKRHLFYKWLQMNAIYTQVNDHICVRLVVKALSASRSWMNTCDATVEKSVTIVLFAISHMLLAGIWSFTISMLISTVCLFISIVGHKVVVFLALM